MVSFPFTCIFKFSWFKASKYPRNMPGKKQTYHFENEQLVQILLHQQNISSSRTSSTVATKLPFDSHHILVW